jgi:putative endopeptidase
MFASGFLQSNGIGALLSVGVVADPMNPSINIAEFDQGGYALPDRSLYLDADAASLRADYINHITTLFDLVEPHSGAAKAQLVLAIETILATSALPGDQIRDPFSVYHRLDLNGLQQLTPNLTWAAFLKGLGAPGITAINVGEPAFFSAVSAALANADPKVRINSTDMRRTWC